MKIKGFGTPGQVGKVSITLNTETEELLPEYGSNGQHEFEYLRDGQWTMIQDGDYPQTEKQHNEAWERAENHPGRKYNVAEYNCEHFVTEVLTGKKRSHQVKAVVTGAMNMVENQLQKHQRFPEGM